VENRRKVTTIVKKYMDIVKYPCVWICTRGKKNIITFWLNIKKKGDDVHLYFEEKGEE